MNDNGNFDNYGRSFTRVIVMLGCFATMGAVLYVYVQINWKDIDGATAGQLGGVLGMILAGALSMANSVIGYDFGSSQGSEKKSDTLAGIAGSPPVAPGTVTTTTTTPTPSTVTTTAAAPGGATVP